VIRDTAGCIDVAPSVMPVPSPSTKTAARVLVEEHREVPERELALTVAARGGGLDAPVHDVARGRALRGDHADGLVGPFVVVEDVRVLEGVAHALRRVEGVALVVAIDGESTSRPTCAATPVSP
jgi:hypothetical protein